FQSLPPAGVENYNSLAASLKEENLLFQDLDFPANDKSIGIPEFRGRVKWKRPKELNPDAEFFVKGPCQFDIKQGELGESWILAVTSTIATYPSLFYRVVPQDQSMLADSYVGMCHFYLWQFGEWRHVTVDDRLPVRKSNDHLLFVQSADKKQYWPSLLEKAFAK
ncbi:calpain family cysteine protease, partial [Opisthorchis viverrini]